MSPAARLRFVEIGRGALDGHTVTNVAEPAIAVTFSTAAVAVAGMRDDRSIVTVPRVGTGVVVGVPMALRVSSTRVGAVAV
jgi:hypothetical protein